MKQLELDGEGSFFIPEPYTEKELEEAIRQEQ